MKYSLFGSIKKPFIYQWECCFLEMLLFISTDSQFTERLYFSKYPNPFYQVPKKEGIKTAKVM